MYLLVVESNHVFLVSTLPKITTCPWTKVSSLKDQISHISFTHFPLYTGIKEIHLFHQQPPPLSSSTTTSQPTMSTQDAFVIRLEAEDYADVDDGE